MTRRNAGPAPVYVDAFDLCRWLLQHFGHDPGILPRTVCETALGLLDSVTLALKGRNREEQLDRADQRLISLRVQLRLAEATGCLSRRQMLYALECADQIGRQLGGWLRTLGPV